MAKKISDLLPETEILAQMAEEASELAQAALKLRRALNGTNPTPKSADECKKNFVEEVGDIMTCLYALGNNEQNEMWDFLGECWDYADGKAERWISRLEERECKKDE